MADPYAALGTVDPQPAAPKQEADPYAALGKAEEPKQKQEMFKPKEKGMIGQAQDAAGKALDWATSDKAGDAIQNYLRGGYLGRATNSVMGRAAAYMMGKPYDPSIAQGQNKASNIEGPQPEEHDASFKEQMAEVYKVATTHPQQFLLEFAKSVGQDPELIFPGLWEYTPAKMAAAAAKIADMSKAAGTITTVGGVAVRGAGVMSGAETLTEVAEGKINKDQIESAAVQGAGFGVAAKGLNRAAKAVKKLLTPTGKATTGKSFKDLMEEVKDKPETKPAEKKANDLSLVPKDDVSKPASAEKQSSPEARAMAAKMSEAGAKREADIEIAKAKRAYAEEQDATKKAAIEKRMQEFRDKVAAEREERLRKNQEIEEAYKQKEQQESQEAAKERLTEGLQSNEEAILNKPKSEAEQIQAQFDMRREIGKGRTKFDERGSVDPKLLATMGLAGLGGYLAVRNTSEDSLVALVGDAIIGGAVGLALAKAPSIYHAFMYEPKNTFADRMIKEHGLTETDRPTLHKMWDKVMPQALKDTETAKRMEARRSVADMMWKAYQADGARKAGIIQAIQAAKVLREQGITPELEEKFFNKNELGSNLMADEQKLYDNIYKPVVDDLGNIVKEIAQLQGKPFKEIQGEFQPRYAKDQKTAIQKLFDGHTNFTSGRASSTFKRSMFQLDTPAGESIAVHIKDGKIEGWKGGTRISADLGTVKDGKYSVDKPLTNDEGKVLGVLKQGSVPFLERNTEVRYWKDAMKTALIKRAEAQAYLDNLKFWKDLKSNAEFKDHIGVPESIAPDEWRSLNAETEKRLPFFKGQKFNPRFAEGIEDIVGTTTTDSGVLEKATNLATKFLLLNPLQHINNESVHWVMDQGLTGTMDRMIHPLDTSNKLGEAYKSVVKMDDVQLELMRQGMSNMFADRWVDNNIKGLFERSMGQVAQTGALQQLGEKLGMAGPELMETLSRKTGDMMWSARQTMVTDLVQRRMAANPDMTPAMAVREVMTSMPSYRLPPRIAEDVFGAILGRKLSQFGANPLGTAFYRYHYAVMSEFGRIGKNVIKASPYESKDLNYQTERMHAMNEVGGLLAMELLYNTIGDGIAKMAASSLGLDEDSAQMRRAGPAHVVELVQNLVQGKPDAALYLALALVSPPMLWGHIEALAGTTSSGIPLRDKNASADVQIGETAADLAKATNIPGFGLLDKDFKVNPDASREELLKMLDLKAKSANKVYRQNRTAKGNMKKESKASSRRED